MSNNIRGLKRRRRWGVILLPVVLALALACDVRAWSTPESQVLPIRPLQQAPGLCGVTTGEMILSYYGVETVGAGYRISQESGGAALGQALCDLLAAGEGDQQQPRCADAGGRPIPVYEGGRPTARTREAYPDGTYLTNVAALLKTHGIHTEYRRSAFDKVAQRYTPDAVRPGFERMLTHLRAGRPAILHVTPRLTRGGGHYLLAIGFDDAKGQLTYLDPNPRRGGPAQATASYEAIASGSGFFREGWFFTGRYLAVTKAP